MARPVHIVFAVDKNYAPFIIPILFQLNKFKVKFDSIKIVVAEDVDVSIRDLLIIKSKHYGFKTEIIETKILNELYTNNLVKDRTHVSYFTYIKLFLPKILESIDQILYLDVDILIRENINNLLSWKLKSPIGAIAELGNNGKKLFKSDESLYFNAGILRMSLKKCREISLSESAEKIIFEKNGHFEFQDQDIFNLLLKNNFDVLPHVYNVFHEHIAISPKIGVFRNPIIVHFNGPSKPWKNMIHSSFVDEWRRDFLRSGGDLSVLGIPESNSETKFDFSSLILKMRFSPIGAKLRQHLPFFIKKSLTELLYRTYKLSRKDNPEILHSLFTRDTDLIEESKSKIDVGENVQDKDQWILPVVSVERNPDKNNERITFIVSQARSGTNALLDYISTLNDSIITAGELFGGHDLPPEIAEIVHKKYPQLVPFDWIEKRANFTDWSEIYSAFIQHQMLVDSQALNIIYDLCSDVSLSKSVFFIKIFPGQLSTQKFNEILDVYKPRIITLRRRMLFSYASLLKARISGDYTNKDNSDVEIHLREKEVANYIAESDEWFNNIDRELFRLKIPSLDITYEGFFESGEDVCRVNDFINETIPVKFDVGRDAIRMTIQDRRKDQYLGVIFEQFAKLPRKLQNYLILQPGNLMPRSASVARLQLNSSKLTSSKLNFMHISKCAGTEIKRYIEYINSNSNISIKSNWHDVNLDQIPEDEYYFFSIRNPITRFVSEFYSRKRQGRPKYDNPWSFKESSAFADFPHANLLAESLLSDGIEGDKARHAMSSIGFIWKNQVDWFNQDESFLITRPPLHVIRQEHFDKDLSSFLQKIDVEFGLILRRDVVLSHMNDYSEMPQLSDLAISNLKQWFDKDFRFYQLCSEWIDENSV